MIALVTDIATLFSDSKIVTYAYIGCVPFPTPTNDGNIFVEIADQNDALYDAELSDLTKIQHKKNSNHQNMYQAITQKTYRT